MSFTMPGTIESVLHKSMVNTLKQNNLWLTSDEIAAKKKDDAGFIQNGNSDYTNHQGTTEKLMAVIIKLALTDSAAAAALFDKIKGENFIQCISKRLYGTKATGEGILIQTTKSNYGIVMRLIEMLPLDSISHYYIVRSNMMKKVTNPDLYDKLIL